MSESSLTMRVNTGANLSFYRRLHVKLCEDILLVSERKMYHSDLMWIFHLKISHSSLVTLYSAYSPPPTTPWPPAPPILP